MITCEEAKRIAVEINEDFDEAYENEEAYLFVDTREEWGGEIIIMKNDGMVMSMSDYAATSTNDSEFKKMPL